MCKSERIQLHLRHQRGTFPEKGNNTLILDFNESLKTLLMYSKHVKRGHQIDDILSEI